MVSCGFGSALMLNTTNSFGKAEVVVVSIERGSFLGIDRIFPFQGEGRRSFTVALRDHRFIVGPQRAPVSFYIATLQWKDIHVGPHCARRARSF
jgi:hypothetical protein